MLLAVVGPRHRRRVGAKPDPRTNAIQATVRSDMKDPPGGADGGTLASRFACALTSQLFESIASCHTTLEKTAQSVKDGIPTRESDGGL